MKLHLIVAHSENLVIGKDGKLPWHYSEDLKHFKSRTMGLPIVMGRGVFEELGEKPLPGRRNIVLTSRSYAQVEYYSSIETALDALRKTEDTCYIIGGGQIYRQTIHLADRLEVTLIHKEIEGDVWFPEYRQDIGKCWKEVNREDFPELSFVDYERV